MPFEYRQPEGGTRKVEFWITSSRGTNNRTEIMVPPDWDASDIKDELEQWCSQFGAWDASENYVRYGWNDEKDFGVRK